MKTGVIVIFWITALSCFSQSYRETIHIDMDDGLSQNTVFAIEEDTLGAIWIGTPGGLHRYNGHEVQEMASIKQTILDLHAIGKYIYCLSIQGLYKIDAHTLKIQSYEFDEKDYFNEHYLENGILLKANMSAKDVYLNYDLESLSLTSVDKNDAGLRDNDFPSININGADYVTNNNGSTRVMDGDSIELIQTYCTQHIQYKDRVFIAAHSGLFEAYEKNGTPALKKHFDFDRIERLMVDSRDNLWIATSANGLYMLHRNAIMSNYYPIMDSKGLEVACWAFMASDQGLFVASSDGMKSVGEPFSDALETATTGIACNIGVSSGGTALIGTSIEGVYMWQNDELSNIYFNEGNALDNSVVFILQNKAGFLVCTKLSLLQFDFHGRLQFRKLNKNTIGGYAMSMHKTTSGYIASTTTGVVVLDEDLKPQKTFRHKNGRVFSECQDSTCVSMDGGLYKLSSDSLSQVAFPDNQLLTISDDWISSTTAIYHKDHHGVQQFTSTNGFPIKEYNQSGMYADTSGRLYYSGLGGVFQFDKEFVTVIPDAPHLLISYNGRNLNYTDEINVSYDQGSINIHAEPIIISDKNLFKASRVLDGKHIPFTEPTTFRYQLPYGESNIILSITNTKTGAAVDHVIRAKRAYPFWMQTWFILLVIFLGSLLILGLYSAIRFIQTRRQLQKEQANRKVTEERLRISNELHDNIGARLTHIISSLDMEMYRSKESTASIEPINKFARETMSQLRETIWAVSDKTIHFSELSLRIEQYVTQANNLTSIDIDFQNRFTGDFELNPVQTINYFRIVQEAMNNAIKYASPDSISIQVEGRASDVEIKISDNGVGFDLNTKAKGTGIEGMKARAKEAGASLTIASETDQGTTVSLSIPLK